MVRVGQSAGGCGAHVVAHRLLPDGGQLHTCAPPTRCCGLPRHADSGGAWGGRRRAAARHVPASARQVLRLPSALATPRRTCDVGCAVGRGHRCQGVVRRVPLPAAAVVSDTPGGLTSAWSAPAAGQAHAAVAGVKLSCGESGGDSQQCAAVRITACGSASVSRQLGSLQAGRGARRRAGVVLRQRAGQDADSGLWAALHSGCTVRHQRRRPAVTALTWGVPARSGYRQSRRPGAQSTSSRASGRAHALIRVPEHRPVPAPVGPIVMVSILPMLGKGGCRASTTSVWPSLTLVPAAGLPSNWRQPAASGLAGRASAAQAAQTSWVQDGQISSQDLRICGHHPAGAHRGVGHLQRGARFQRPGLRHGSGSAC